MRSTGLCINGSVLNELFASDSNCSCGNVEYNSSSLLCYFRACKTVDRGQDKEI